MLTWARESLNLGVPAAAKKVGVSESVLQRWETGDLAPTVTQLRKTASVYKRPLAVLLLPEPPKDFSVPRDFREGPESPSPELLAEIRRAHEQREVLLEIRQAARDLAPATQPLPQLSDDAESAGTKLREYLGVSLAEQRSWRNPHEALNGWIGAAESRGVLVIQTSRVDREEALGFSLHGDDFPVVALNGSDWPRRKVFTLLHELAHLGLGRGGICDLHDSPPSTADVEARCNRIAASALLPRDALLALVTDLGLPGSDGWQLEALDAISRPFGVSQEATLLRLVTLRVATWDEYADIRRELVARYREADETEREKRKERSGGPNYYVVHSRNLGRAYTAAVLGAYHANAISSVAAANYLGVRFQQLPKLEAVA